MKTLLWFRNDLRLDDHRPLIEAAQAGPVLPVYVLDPASFGETAAGFPRCGPHRARFLRESLDDLARSIAAAGGRLLIVHEPPQQAIPRLVWQYEIDRVAAHRFPGTEEQRLEERVDDALKQASEAGSFDSRHVRVHWQEGHAMLHPEDLPFPVESLPGVFTAFRKKVEKSSPVREPLDRPSHVTWIAPEATDSTSESTTDSTPDQTTDPSTDSTTRNSRIHPRAASTSGREAIDWRGSPLDPAGDLPADPRAVLPFRGGETEGRGRLEHYLWQGDHLRRYKQTRNGLLGADYSSKFSPWLANGSLSARRIHADVKRYEAERVANESTYWMVFELLWRDFFQFSALQHGARLFASGGIQGKAVNQRRDLRAFAVWSQARTGVPFVDANLTELNLTGFMSNRGRQNVASYLSQNMGLDWRLGAEYFESMLIDFDVASNWGNWAYNSTVGHDPRNRRFDVDRQAHMYDRDGAYRRTWLPGVDID